LSITHVSTSCWADPFSTTSPFPIVNSYEYSPLVIEASILSNERNVRKSTGQIKKALKKQIKANNMETELGQFLERREAFLLELQSVPQVESFVRFTIDKAEEVRKSQEEIKESLATIGASRDLQRELSRAIRPQFKRRNLLIDAIRDAILVEGKESLVAKSLLNYIENFNTELNRLVNERTKSEIVYTILAADLQFLATERQLLRTGQSIAVPLDLSPLRLSLALIKDTKIFEQSQIYYPPLFLLFNPKEDAFNLARPYRTIDGHPAFIRAPRFEADKNTAQREAADARENFEQKIGPLLYGIKGLAGTGETSPSLITKPLINVVWSYLTFNPFSKEMLRIMDLGCGTGALLKKIFIKVLDKCSLDERISVYSLLNDDSQQDPGKRFRHLFLEEPYVGLVDSRSWKGDMRKLIVELKALEERFDIAFINRVLDMYGGYGIFEFKFQPKAINEYCSSLTETMQAKDPNVGFVLAFPESTCHEDAWRAIKYIFERQVHKKEEGAYLLPSIDMKMKKNFFDVDGVDIFENLLAISKLLVISVFPGNFHALFPEIDPIKNNIFYCGKFSSKSYSILCISRNKELIEHIKSQCQDFGD